jgi:PhnB protein
MAKVSTYLNFNGNTEEAFNFYKSIFGTQFEGQIMRFGDMPPQEGMPPMNDKVKNKVMHMALPITAGHLLMGTDSIEEMGFKLTQGNNVYICLQPDTRKEADRLFKSLSEGGKIEMQLEEQFWGDYYGSWSDKYGIQWMINTDAKQ